MTAALLAVAGVCAAFAWRGAPRAAERERWPTVEGVVERAPSPPLIRRGQVVRRAHEEGRILVRYDVRGTRHASQALERGALSAYGDSSDAELRARRYPAGARVALRYDPRDPARAVLPDERDVARVWLPAWALACLLVAGLTAVTRAPPRAAVFGALPLPFVAIGLGLLLTGAVELWRAAQSARWPAVPGTIVFAAAELSRVEGLATPVVYRYDVDGRTYHGNLRLFGGPAARGERVSHRAVGDTVTVRHAPGRPTLSVLQPGTTPGAWIMPGVGLAFLAIGIAGCTLLMRTTGPGERGAGASRRGRRR
jgi:hypothetical protein